MINLQRDLAVTIAGVNRVAEVVEVHIESRFEVTAGISPVLEIPYATITLSTDANITQKMSVQIQVTTLNAYRNVTRYPGAINLFLGEVDSVNETVTPFGMRLVSILAYSPVRKLLNGKIDSYIVNFAHSPESRARVALAQANAQSWPPTSPATMITQSGTSSGSQMPAETLTNLTTGEVIQSALDCEAGTITHALWDSTLTSDVFYWYPRGTYSSWGGATPDPTQTSFLAAITHPVQRISAP